MFEMQPSKFGRKTFVIDTLRRLSRLQRNRERFSRAVFLSDRSVGHFDGHSQRVVGRISEMNLWLRSTQPIYLSIWCLVTEREIVGSDILSRCPAG